MAATNAVLLEFRQQIECLHPQRFLTISNGLELPVRTTVRTHERAAALVRLANATVLRLAERSELELLDPEETDEPPLLHLLRGSFFSHSRRNRGGVRIRTGVANAVTTGTDFEAVAEPGRTVFRVFDGSVRVANAVGAATATSGSQIVVSPAEKPRVELILVPDLVQWWLRYPAALDLRELSLNPTERQQLTQSIAAWNKGNIRSAVEAWPRDAQLETPAARLFAAAIELAAGRVDRAEALAANIGTLPAADGVRAIISVVAGHAWDTNLPLASASAWLGLSWWRQSRHEIDAALAAARAAVQRAPDWGLAWARVAELEFSRGDTRAAKNAVARALLHAPEYAPAHALQGFIHAARNRNDDALRSFDDALRLDGLLADAWLGRGLCLIRAGRPEEGRLALQNAVGAEPARSILRSYLGKAWEEANETGRARQDLDYAQRLDACDPTPWLYSALLEEREHRYNEAVRDLEQSMALNENRAVYRSELLLDRDRAVRGANLARIYDRAGLTEVGMREASRSASWDYANWSAHLFLAESYDALRDPARVNLRFETPWFNELLLARLLAPAAAGAFSQNLSQQEYTRLFEANRIGLNSSTEWRSDGRFRERATHYGLDDSTSWAIDLDWEQRDERNHLNNDLRRLEIYPQLKQQVTESDSLLLFAKFYDYRAGDVRQLGNPRRADLTLDSEVSQLPIAAAGWHHEWAPGVHTLLLGARLEDEQRVRTDALGALGFYQPAPASPPLSAETNTLSLRYRSQLEIWSGEINQIIEAPQHTFVFGARGQSGDFATRDVLRTNAFTGAGSFFENPAAMGAVIEDFTRFALYGYDHYEPFKGVMLIGGVAYDRVDYPRNFAAPPIQSGTRSRDLLGPKGGLVWSPLDWLTVRGMYAQSLGGASFDESFRLEPSQVAGFPQAYRSLLPESAGGGGSAQRLELWGAAADLRLASHTYIGLEGARRTSREANTIGAFELGSSGNYVPAAIRERRAYEETALGTSVHQLIGDDWSMGGGWRFTRSDLDVGRPLLPENLGAPALAAHRADLHQAWARLLFNHGSGFFARADVESFWQQSTSTSTASRHEAVVELHCFAGWRFKKQRGEVSAGVLNLTDEDHRLNPLNALAEVPRERVFVARLQLNF